MQYQLSYKVILDSEELQIFEFLMHVSGVFFIFYTDSITIYDVSELECFPARLCDSIQHHKWATLTPSVLLLLLPV